MSYKPVLLQVHATHYYISISTALSLFAYANLWKSVTHVPVPLSWKTILWVKLSEGTIRHRQKKVNEKGSGKTIYKKLVTTNKRNHTTFFLSLCSIAPLSPAFIFHRGRYQTQMRGERKGERRENNYPLPQPAGLFINTQLWFHGGPLHKATPGQKALPRRDHWEHLKHWNG